MTHQATLHPASTDRLPADHASRCDRAWLAFEGLFVGDAFGGRFFSPPGQSREVPPAPWPYSDDTIMAWAVWNRLRADGEVNPDALACDFAGLYQAAPYRGYGMSVRRTLDRIADGMPWPQAAQFVFEGAGSMGNGGAMRVAPLGAYFADDLDAVVEQADLSAATTHAHLEGRAGAIAVAIGAAMAARGASAVEMLETAQDRTPGGLTRDGIASALTLGLEATAQEAASLLGNGSRITSPDTVPFALWCAARHWGDYAESLWSAVSVGGDNDTLGAIVGGIAALAAGMGSIPERWRSSREPLHLPQTFGEESR